MSPLYINGRFFAQPLTGVQRYAREPLEAMDRLWPDSPLADRPATVLLPAGAEAPALRLKSVTGSRRQQQPVMVCGSRYIRWIGPICPTKSC